MDETSRLTLTVKELDAILGHVEVQSFRAEKLETLQRLFARGVAAGREEQRRRDAEIVHQMERGPWATQGINPEVVEWNGLPSDRAYCAVATVAAAIESSK